MKRATIPILVYSFLLFLSSLFLSLHAGSGGEANDPYLKKRHHMVLKQIEGRGIKDEKVLHVMKKVPRHLFVPFYLRHQAYNDNPLPIGEGQTISQPYIVALMTELLNVGPKDRVLEVGTGSGYQAAILSELAGEVVTMEIFGSLAEPARKRLEKLKYKNVTVINSDGYFGYEKKAPFDGIIVTCAAPHVPPTLIGQLKEGGRMIIPVGAPFMTQNLMLVRKEKDGSVKTDSVLPVIFVPLLGH